MVLEIISNSVESAMAAERGGADRIELCENLIEGGVTPSIGCIELTRKNVSVDVFVMIRPRGGDFLYSDMEFEVMKQNILATKNLGIQGFVLGILKEDGRIDVERTRELVELAKPLEVTFHRAFDAVIDPYEALEDVIRTGATRILTSGLKNSALEGSEIITEMVRHANSRIAIMAGGGINPDNICQLIEKTSAPEYHFSAKMYVDSNMHYRSTNLNIGYRQKASEYERLAVDENKVRAVKELMMGFVES